MNKLVEKGTLLLVGAAIALSVYVFVIPTLAHSAQQKYKVIPAGHANSTSLQQVENMLNKEASQGWVYAGSVGTLIILRK